MKNPIGQVKISGSMNGLPFVDTYNHVSSVDMIEGHLAVTRYIEDLGHDFTIAGYAPGTWSIVLANPATSDD